MGLFSRKKESSSANLQFQQVPSFQKLMETPPEPPPAIGKNVQHILDNPPMPPAMLDTHPSMEGFPPEPPNLIPGSAPPSFDQGVSRIPAPPSHAGQAPPFPGEMQEEQFTAAEANEFELPDFDDAELESLRELEKKNLAPPEKEEPVRAPEKKGWAEDPLLAVAPPRRPTERIELVPSPEPIKREVKPLISQKYVELSDFFKLKETLTQAKMITRDMEEEMLEETYKARLAKITTFSTTLNAIQDRLMLIDGKLFESPEVND